MKRLLADALDRILAKLDARFLQSCSEVLLHHRNLQNPSVRLFGRVKPNFPIDPITLKLEAQRFGHYLQAAWGYQDESATFEVVRKTVANLKADLTGNLEQLDAFRDPIIIIHDEKNQEFVFVVSHKDYDLYHGWLLATAFIQNLKHPGARIEYDRVIPLKGVLSLGQAVGLLMKAFVEGSAVATLLYQRQFLFALVRRFLGLSRLPFESRANKGPTTIKVNSAELLPHQGKALKNIVQQKHRKTYNMSALLVDALHEACKRVGIDELIGMLPVVMAPCIRSQVNFNQIGNIGFSIGRRHRRVDFERGLRSPMIPMANTRFISFWPRALLRWSSQQMLRGTPLGKRLVTFDLVLSYVNDLNKIATYHHGAAADLKTVSVPDGFTSSTLIPQLSCGFDQDRFWMTLAHSSLHNQEKAERFFQSFFTVLQEWADQAGKEAETEVFANGAQGSTRSA